jgi:type I restriction-modification system DNA methylase subunit
MGRSTVHYADNKTNNALKSLHNKLRPAGTPVQRVEYIIELLLLRIFETKIKQDDEFKPLRELFSTDYKWLNPKTGKEESNENCLFSYLPSVSNDQILSELNDNFFPFYSTILHSARKVFKGNLPQKVQDQLVLIEEVFSNSNFTNNVNSGNLGEVISIIANDIEENRLLQTDLLGDAIESALSETGGTKDIGLFRTPDHVRQFMTALIEPTFDDVIFDPACGTGGFLFDAFEFVMRRVDPTREWPGEKAHSELADWFDNYFEKNQIEFPSIEQTTQFYRSGVTGVEYLGMIRKMAAINFYIRGLNPANIEQGDSLAKYRPVTDHETKSIILANPPFGAQRDQEAYPDVWGEYSKESETTILFVKLMFEHLKQGGHCAVVVSEGFHTWDQFSAKALRKMLLEEAQLKAVISLPQGLFVSKNGQGPKTSILVFEKGGTSTGSVSTDWTWFYKVTNDGYTMGTNRKEQKGNQLVECLSLYHEFVKHGKKPEETKNQFSIPAEWVKTLDPRIKEKIRIETRTDMEAKGKIEKAKKADELDKKIKAKKITEADKQMELKVFDQMLENRIQNEIAKRIDKAHNYSFNFANYKSSLNLDLFDLADELDFKFDKINDSNEVEKIYQSLQKNHANPEITKIIVQTLNLASALEADIAREYVSNLDNELILKHKELNVIKEILKSKQKYPIEKLEGKVEPKFIKIKKENYDGEIDIVDKISFKDGKIHYRDNKETGMDLYQAEKGDLVTSKINVHQGALALADRKLVCSTHYQVYEIDKTQINPEFLVITLRSKQLQDRVSEIKNGGIKNEQGADFLLSLEIPLPSLDEQTAIVAQIEKQKAIIEGVEKITENWEADFSFTKFSKDNWKEKSIGDVCSFEYGKTLKEIDRIDGEYPVVGAGNIIGYHNDFYLEGPVISTGRRGATSGSIQWIEKNCFVIDTAFYVEILNKKEVNKRFLFYVLRNLNLQKLQSGGAMPGINRNDAYKEKFLLPDIDTQEKIVAELDSQMQILDGLRKMKTEAEKKINKILADVWGVEYVESIKVEVEDEQEN